LSQIEDAWQGAGDIERPANYCAAIRRIGTEYLPLLLNM
jgi:hypothetical protein